MIDEPQEGLISLCTLAAPARRRNGSVPPCRDEERSADNDPLRDTCLRLNMTGVRPIFPQNEVQSRNHHEVTW